jgi:hypothetical protein
MTDLVKMVRGGKFADVHPSEVENYKLGDWRVAEPEPKPKTGKQDKKESAE